MSEDLSRTVSEAMGKPWRAKRMGCCTCQTCGQYYDDGCLCDWADNPENLRFWKMKSNGAGCKRDTWTHQQARLMPCHSITCCTHGHSSRHARNSAPRILEA